LCDKPPHIRFCRIVAGNFVSIPAGFAAYGLSKEDVDAFVDGVAIAVSTSVRPDQ